MATRKIQNTTISFIYLTDFGNQALEPAGDPEGDDIFVLVDQEAKARHSTQLFDLISKGDIAVLDAEDNPIQDVVKAWDWLLVKPQELPLSEVGDKLWVHSSSKPQKNGQQFYTCWTGAADDVVNGILGAGEPFDLETTIDEPVVYKDFFFDPQFGEIYIHEAYLKWMDSSFGDSMTGYIIASPTQLQPFANLDLVLTPVIGGNKISYSPSGPGTGTHGFAANPTLVPNISGTGDWNYDATNGLAPTFTKDGAYDMYDVVIPVQRFINRIQLHGTCPSYLELDSSDSASLPPGYGLRVQLNNVSNTAWHVHLIVLIYRERTI